ncbi:HEAT repeat domain-containing protein [Ancylothrix sp. C2]|uniref:HEAT repeat domain-containing protein n=1 Tax=Ancylothrix sp. D3o TaxID=2953691 RepID=UPI0021BB991E|nr:HEAT repeat domain-containing protein [Ancylothrix sp. D3o]MCT7951431.1 HEAT repeat domain-containing protein [Ancylothrix sp. D3o]
MRKNSRHQLLAALTVSLLSITSPLLLNSIAWGQNSAEKQAGAGEVAPLIEKLKTADKFNRDDTIEKLAKIGTPAVPQLIKALESDNVAVRQGAVSALRTIGEPAVPSLIKAFQSKNVRVRWSAADALGSFFNEHDQTVISALAKLLKDSDVGVRRRAAESLSSNSLLWSYKNNTAPAGFEAAIPQFVEALKDSDAAVRSSAAAVLGNIGTEAKVAIPQLVEALKDSDADVRSSAASALRYMGTEAKVAIPQLVELLKDSDAAVRNSAASVLGNIATEAKAAIPQLVKLLKDSDADVRNSAASALGKMGTEAKAAIPQLVELLKDSDAGVRSIAAAVLGDMGTEAKAAIPQLVELLKDSDADVRSYAASALGDMGTEAKVVILQLVEALKDSDNRVRSRASNILPIIALNLQDNRKKLSSTDLEKAIKGLETALEILKNSKDAFPAENLSRLETSLSELKDEKNSRLLTIILKNPWICGILIYLIFFPSLWFILLRIRPLWILAINDALIPYEFKFPETWGGAPVRIRDLTFFIFFTYRPRVLDAWVSKHIKTAREEFYKLETVKNRSTYVPVAIEIDTKKEPQITAENLQPIFSKKRICLLIWGEGGIGKTSIACQIALAAMEPDETKRLCKHLMIPVLIEQELDGQITQGKHPFLDTIRGQLKALTHHPRPIDETLLKKLLQQRRILVIVDHFSELTQATQKLIDPYSAEFPVNALAITTRLENSLGKASKTTIHPLRIKGGELAIFLEKYLEKLGKPHLLTEDKLFHHCRDLAKLLEVIRAQGRSTTVLFAKLYTDLLIAKLEGNKEEKLPENIPDLMLSYIDELNCAIAENPLDITAVQRDAKALAWKCLKSTYKPASIKRQDALAVLSELNSQDAEIRLKYLEEKLHLIETIRPAKENIRFSLDPVAEYLAGLHLVGDNKKNKDKWKVFMSKANRMSSEEIKGFLLAVRDSYLAEEWAKDSDYLPTEIAGRCIPQTTP